MKRSTKKKRFQKAKHDHRLRYTIIVTPNTYGRTHKFSISYFWIKNAAFLFGLIVTVLVLVIVAYVGLLSNYNQSKQDLLTLQEINKDQQVQLYDMTELAKEVDTKLQYLDLLETKIETMLGDDNTSSINDPYMNEINAKLAELENNMAASGSGDDAYMNYYVSSTDISDFDVSTDLDAIKTELTALSVSIETEQNTYTGLQTDVAAQTDYIQCYPDLLPLSGTLTDGFGYRTTPRVGFHNGIDIAAPRGTEIRSAGKGTVTYAAWFGNYGNCVIVDHGYGYKTLYGHMSKILVEVGDKASKGDVLGLVGSTGFSTGNHLHFGIMVNGTFVDPLDFVVLKTESLL